MSLAVQTHPCLALMVALTLVSTHAFAQVPPATGGAGGSSGTGAEPTTPSGGGAAASDSAKEQDECGTLTAARHLELARDAIQEADEFLARVNASQAIVGEELFDNQLTGLQSAMDHARCARKLNGPDAAEVERKADAKQDEVHLGQFRYLATLAADEAEAALNDTKKAKTLETAKDSAKLAREAAVKARTNRARARDDSKLNEIIRRADTAADEAQRDVDGRERGASSICGLTEAGQHKNVCGSYGLFAAALSYVYTSLGKHNGTSHAKLASIAVPGVALRWNPDTVEWFAVDIGAYSAFLTKGLATTIPEGTRSSCTKNGGEYEDRLPCEANPAVYPYLALYAGVTAGRSGVGYITLAPLTVGMGQVGNRTGLKPFIGWTVGILQLNGNF